MTSRRSFLAGGLATIIVAPAIVRASSLMAIKPVRYDYEAVYTTIALGYAITREAIERNLYGSLPFNVLTMPEMVGLNALPQSHT